jgi:very-short-patch-repair endonuclease
VLGPIHVNREGAGGPAQRGGRVKIHRARIPETDITVVRGLRTTTPTRTLLDVAAKQPRYALFRALEQAERLTLHVDRERLDDNPHLKQPLELFDHYGPCTRSDAEAMFLFVCEDHGIARPRVNEQLNGREADFHWPEHRLVVEVEGYEFHEGLPAFRDDRCRGNRFRLAGYEVIRFAASDVEHEPAEVAKTLLAARPALRSRVPVLAPSSPRGTGGRRAHRAGR